MKASVKVRQVAATLLALAPAMFIVDPIRNLIESQMITHMLLQFPLLFASGWMIALALSRRATWLDGVGAIDAHGLLAVNFASCALAFWMIPTALDLALLSEPVRWAKYISLWLTGFLLSLTRKRLSTEVEVFFLGMLIWMMATVGLIYQTMSQRLCVSYLLDEQRWTGIGLVTAAVLLTCVVLWRIGAKRLINRAAPTEAWDKPN